MTGRETLPPRPPITDPKAVPVVGTDAHLPAVPPERLAPAALRARFAAPPAWEPELRGDLQALDAGAAARPASVLVPLVAHAQGVTVLLTRRTSHLRHHAGQIAFPGGGVEHGDADAVAAALRETREEIGLPASAIELIGRLPAYRTITRFEVTPVVGLVAPGYALALDTHEVAEVFEVPLAFLMDPAHHQRHAVDFAGRRRQFLSMPWHAPGPGGEAREFFVWGATAAMLRNLYGFLAA